MTAKEWLQRSWKIDREITALQNMLDETYSRLTSITANMGSVTVQGTKDVHKFDRVGELSDKIGERIAQLVTVKNEVAEAIAQVDGERYRTLLIDRYTRYMTWEQIAVEMNYSYMQICRLHGDALRAVEPVIKKML